MQIHWAAVGSLWTRVPNPSCLFDSVSFCQMQHGRAAHSLKFWPPFPAASGMKLTEENKLQFLLWLADNHALELRQHSKQNKAKPTDGTKNWWERRELPAPFETCAILSTSLISDKLDEWSKLPAGASVGDLTGDCGSKKAMTAFIRQALSVDDVFEWYQLVAKPKMPLPASPLSASRAKVCTDAARDKGPDKHTPSGPVSEYFLIVPGGVDAFLEAVRSAVAGGEL